MMPVTPPQTARLIIDPNTESTPRTTPAMPHPLFLPLCAPTAPKIIARIPANPAQLHEVKSEMIPRTNAAIDIIVISSELQTLPEWKKSVKF